MVSIWVEPGFSESIWCRQILQGLTSELKKRREPYTMQEDGDPVIVIGSSAEWLSAQVAECNRAGQVPVLLCNSQRKISGGRYHCVCSDIAGSMRLLTAAMVRRWGPRLALYGVNPQSVGDRSRREAFSLECGGPCLENNGSLEACFREFLPLLDQVDGVICANGFAAVSLYRRLLALGRSVPMISCGQTQLCRRYGEAIPSVDENYGAFGKTALGILDLVRKDPQISELTVTVRWAGEQLPGSLPPVIPPAATDRFYRDGELQQMQKVEDLLNSCDETDRQLLPMLLAGQSYALMAQACYLTEGAVKYRIKNMRLICDCADRESLEAVLRSWLP